MFRYNQLIEKDNKNHYVGKMCVLFLSFGGLLSRRRVPVAFTLITAVFSALAANLAGRSPI